MPHRVREAFVAISKSEDNDESIRKDTEKGSLTVAEQPNFTTALNGLKGLYEDVILRSQGRHHAWTDSEARGCHIDEYQRHQMAAVAMKKQRTCEKIAEDAARRVQHAASAKRIRARPLGAYQARASA